MTYFIFVTGGVLSSVGKGILAASIGKMIQARGFKVSAIKIDPYLNVDAGTMNPLVHGEVFVTEDGGETDLDIGHYERFLDINLNKENNITTGQIYQTVIERERRGDYLGLCVQVVPHITDEIKRRIKLVAEKSNADFIIVEVGGTVGDIESQPFLEAIRQMALEHPGRTLFIHIALVPILDVTGEQKTKPLQHSVNELRRIGIQPHIIVARCKMPLDHEVKKKIALFGNVPDEAVFTSYNVDYIYELPLVLDSQGMGDYICRLLGLHLYKANWDNWIEVVNSFKKSTVKVSIALCGKYVKTTDAYISINEALKHAAASLGVGVDIEFIDAEKIERKQLDVNILSKFDGVVIPPGFGARGFLGKLEAIRFARENNIPLLGICFGMQLSIVEFARNVLGLKNANTTEIDPNTPYPVVDLLPEQREVSFKGGTMRLGSYPIVLKEGTLTHLLYKRKIIYERHRHRYEVNKDYLETLANHGLIVSGHSLNDQRAEFIEFPSHPFFLCTQAHPEYKSRPGNPSPVYVGLINASIERLKSRKMHHNHYEEALNS